ncbi:MAG: four helix bundle protein [Spirochaetales bacterium]|nr:four helix bundle protein [Spirochaetales bacterium]
MINRDIRERCFEFSARIINLGFSLQKMGGICFIFANQLVKSGTSVGANLEEAQGGQSRRDFIAKMSISLKESLETVYWLRLLRHTKILGEKELDPIIGEANEITSIITAILKSTKKLK